MANLLGVASVGLKRYAPLAWLLVRPLKRPKDSARLCTPSAESSRPVVASKRAAPPKEVPRVKVDPTEPDSREGSQEEAELPAAATDDGADSPARVPSGWPKARTASRIDDGSEPSSTDAVTDAAAAHEAAPPSPSSHRSTTMIVPPSAGTVTSTASSTWSAAGKVSTGDQAGDTCAGSGSLVSPSRTRSEVPASTATVTRMVRVLGWSFVTSTGRGRAFNTVRGASAFASASSTSSHSQMSRRLASSVECSESRAAHASPAARRARHPAACSMPP
mmetsp:Transcript_2384/g.7627  ORF Transcript_2384/g.7627 Transcript_2384/m.7627 type:complete len:276 (+) Transcript_2384:3185-4012(+)